MCNSMRPGTLFDNNEQHLIVYSMWKFADARQIHMSRQKFTKREYKEPQLL